MGVSPAATSVAAARIPAGPAPTMTGGRSAIARDQPHAVGDGAGACPETLAVGQRDPAILAGPHQAETGPRLAGELAVAQAPSVDQQGGQDRIAGEGFARDAIDGEMDDRSAALGQA